LPRLARGFSLAYQKATTKTVVADFNFTANFAEHPQVSFVVPKISFDIDNSADLLYNFIIDRPSGK